MRIRLLMDWADAMHPFTPAGAIIDVDDVTGRALLQNGTGEPAMTDPEVAVLPAPRKAARTKRGKR